jgi:murein DD-endopeptidase MepM/ murein hydrolase activator NlpD
LRQFYSPRTRLFRKRRLRLRHIILPVLAATAIGALLSTGEPQAPVTVAGVSAVKPAAVVVPQDIKTADILPVRKPAAITRAEGETAANNLKAAFDAIPQKTAFTYQAASAARTDDSTIGSKLSSLQSGITSRLEAGDTLVASRTLPVGKGDTLMDILVRNDVPRGEAHEAIAALSKVYDPRGLSPRHEITVFFNRDPQVADPKFQGLSIETDVINTVSVNRGNDGSYSAGEATKDTQRVTRAYRGPINSSLYVSAKAQGVPDAVILEMIKMYSMQIDFQRDIQSGNNFEVMFDQYVTDSGDSVPGRGHILYVNLDLGERSLPLYRYEDKDGEVAYYDANGKSAKRSLMRTPIDGARISSGYGLRRHPVLGYSKMHKGIDFAAPRGTPIYAAGDGKIAKIGPFSSYGNYIKIRHGNGLETAYAHLNGFKSGLKNGARVKQGQVIGYVGTTGRSTGPHLHYEVMQNGQQVNPNKLNLPQGNALAGRALKEFKANVSRIQSDFDKQSRSPSPVAQKTGDKPQTASRQ